MKKNDGNEPYLISSVRVHLTSSICGVDVDVSLVDGTSDENVGRGLKELNTGKGAGRHGTGTMTGLAAPSDSLSFLVTNERVGIRRTPKAEV